MRNWGCLIFLLSFSVIGCGQAFQSAGGSASIASQSPSPSPAPSPNPAPSPSPSPNPAPSPSPSPSPAPSPAPSPSPSPSPSPAPVPVGVTGNFALTFQDEFDGSSISQRWTTTADYQINAELQCYLPGNISVSGGNLLLTGKKENVTCPYYSGSKAATYSSGEVTTSKSFSQLYGYFEMRAIIPGGQGIWPAFWMLPANGGWPPEIDVFEFINNDPAAYQTYHWSSSNQYDLTAAPIPDHTQNWNVYGLSWTPTAITWYVNGVKTKQFTNKSAITNEPMYMIINLAIGGSWPGSPNASTIFPSTMKVDYVRAWSCSDLTKCGS